MRRTLLALSVWTALGLAAADAAGRRPAPPGPPAPIAIGFVVIEPGAPMSPGGFVLPLIEPAPLEAGARRTP